MFRDGVVIGIAFQTLDDAENIGEIVPSPIIRRFIQAVEQGRSQEIPGLSIQTQLLENKALRQSVGLTGKESGILVTAVEFDGATWGVLQPGDVLMEVDGHRVENNGTTRYAGNIRTRFDVVLSEKFVGDRIPISFKRDGETRVATIELKPRLYLAPRSRYETKPSFFVFSGLVFQPLSQDFLETWNDWWDKAPTDLLQLYYGGVRTEARQEVVVLSQVLADKLTVGYEAFATEIITEVNGKAPRDLAHLVAMVEASTDAVQLKTGSGARIYLETSAARGAHQRLLDRYHIPVDRSQGLGGQTPVDPD